MNSHDAIADTPSLTALQDQISGLFTANPQEVQAGHIDLGPDLWLSCDPAGRARVTLRAGDEGIALDLTEADSGGWCCLGMRIAPEALIGARYIGVLVALRSEGLIAYTPSLRYHIRDGGMQDVPADPVVQAPGAREVLSYMPVDPELLHRADSCELNLFFQTNTLSAVVSRLDVLVMR